MTDKRILCAEEREVIIRFDDSTKTAQAYSCNKSWRDKLKKLQRENPHDVKVISDNSSWGAYEIEFPKSWIKIKPPRKSNLTEEEKKSIGDRLAKARQSK